MPPDGKLPPSFAELQAILDNGLPPSDSSVPASIPSDLVVPYRGASFCISTAWILQVLCGGETPAHDGGVSLVAETAQCLERVVEKTGAAVATVSARLCTGRHGAARFGTVIKPNAHQVAVFSAGVVSAGLRFALGQPTITRAPIDPELISARWGKLREATQVGVGGLVDWRAIVAEMEWEACNVPAVPTITPSPLANAYAQRANILPDNSIAPPQSPFTAEQTKWLNEHGIAISTTYYPWAIPGGGNKLGNRPLTADPAREQYVTLDQMAALVNRSKRTAEKWLTRPKNPLPEADVQGLGGKPSEWIYASVRSWLENESGKQLPEHFPAGRHARRN
jgi:hypothetical protein